MAAFNAAARQAGMRVVEQQINWPEKDWAMSPVPAGSVASGQGLAQKDRASTTGPIAWARLRAGQGLFGKEFCDACGKDHEAPGSVPFRLHLSGNLRGPGAFGAGARHFLKQLRGIRQLVGIGLCQTFEGLFSGGCRAGRGCRRKITDEPAFDLLAHNAGQMLRWCAGSLGNQVFFRWKQSAPSLSRKIRKRTPGSCQALIFLG